MYKHISVKQSEIIISHFVPPNYHNTPQWGLCLTQLSPKKVENMCCYVLRHHFFSDPLCRNIVKEIFIKLDTKMMHFLQTYLA